MLLSAGSSPSCTPQFQMQAPQWTHFSRSNTGTPPGARGDRLAGAHLDAQFGDAALAEIRIDEAHVVGVAGRRLHLAAHQQRVLVRHQQLAVVGNGRPPHAVHQRIVATDTARAAVFHDLCQFGGGNLSRGNTPPGLGISLGSPLTECLPSVKPAIAIPSSPGNHAAVEAVARLLGDCALLPPPNWRGAAPRKWLRDFPWRAACPHCSSSSTASPSWTPVVHASSTPLPVSTFVLPEPSPMRA